MHYLVMVVTVKLMGADDMAMTYRLIGTASYNNFMNSPWTLSPNFAWAHDFRGNAPSSLGGFVEDRMTLSLGASLSKGWYFSIWIIH